MPLDDSILAAIRNRYVASINEITIPSITDLCSEYELTSKEIRRVNKIAESESWEVVRLEGYKKMQSRLLHGVDEKVDGMVIDLATIMQSQIAVRIKSSNMLKNAVDDRIMAKLNDPDYKPSMNMLARLKKLSLDDEDKLAKSINDLVKTIHDISGAKKAPPMKGVIRAPEDGLDEESGVSPGLASDLNMWKQGALALEAVDHHYAVPEEDRLAVTSKEKITLFEQLDAGVDVTLKSEEEEDDELDYNIDDEEDGPADDDE